MDDPRSVSEAVAAHTIDPGDDFAPDTKETAKAAAASLPAEPVDAKALAAMPEWKERDVRNALRSMTTGIDGIAGGKVGASLTMTEQELSALAPPLTNIINRTPMLRSMSSASDAVAAGMAMLGYAMRVGGEAADTKRLRQRAEQLKIEAEQAKYEPVSIDNTEVSYS